MEDLRRRTDSLSPPYPAFDEHIRAMLSDGWSAKDIAAMFKHHGRPLKEQAVNAWASGSAPATNLHADIRRHLDYDFAERAFAAAAQAAGFPPEDGPEELKRIRTCRELKKFVGGLTEVVRIEAIKDLAGHKSASSLGNFINKDDKSLSHDLFVSLLSALPQAVRQSNGEELGPCTPTLVLAEIAKECRLASGFDRKIFAKRMGVSPDYLRYLEEIVSRAEREDDASRGKGGVVNPERHAKLCKALSRERIRLGLVPGGEELSEDAEPPSEPSPEAAPDSSDEQAAELRQALGRLTAEVAELRRELTEAFGREHPKDDGYRGPFGTGRGQTHDFRPDGMRLRLVGSAMKLLTEELGLLAGIGDVLLKQKVRAELTQPLQELFAAIEIFQQKNPFSPTIAKLFEGWRRGFDAELGRTRDE